PILDGPSARLELPGAALQRARPCFYGGDARVNLSRRTHRVWVENHLLRNQFTLVIPRALRFNMQARHERICFHSALTAEHAVLHLDLCRLGQLYSAYRVIVAAKLQRV